VTEKAERGFLNSEHFKSMSTSGTVDPSKIRFSQAGAGARFRAGGEVDKLATVLARPIVEALNLMISDGQAVGKLADYMELWL
jgi:hypothetical protein